MDFCFFFISYLILIVFSLSRLYLLSLFHHFCFFSLEFWEWFWERFWKRCIIVSKWFLNSFFFFFLRVLFGSFFKMGYLKTRRKREEKKIKTRLSLKIFAIFECIFVYFLVRMDPIFAIWRKWESQKKEKEKQLTEIIILKELFSFERKIYTIYIVFNYQIIKQKE